METDKILLLSVVKLAKKISLENALNVHMGLCLGSELYTVHFFNQVDSNENKWYAGEHYGHEANEHQLEIYFVLSGGAERCLEMFLNAIDGRDFDLFKHGKVNGLDQKNACDQHRVHHNGHLGHLQHVHYNTSMRMSSQCYYYHHGHLRLAGMVIRARLGRQ